MHNSNTLCIKIFSILLENDSTVLEIIFSYCALKFKILAFYNKNIVVEMIFRYSVLDHVVFFYVRYLQEK